MIKLMAIDDEGNEFLISKTEDDTMFLDGPDAGLFHLFKEGVTFEIRAGEDAG